MEQRDLVELRSSEKKLASQVEVQQAELAELMKENAALEAKVRHPMHVPCYTGCILCRPWPY
jgi:hypothetical protein